MIKKKSILTYVLAFMLIIPTMFILTACGEHTHNYGVTGTCSCGESVATTITKASLNENDEITFKNIVDNKIYFNFTSCGVENINIDTETQQGDVDSTTPALIESVDVYKDGEKVGSLQKSFYQNTSGTNRNYWIWDSVRDSENPFKTEANTKYNVVITLDKHYDEFTIYFDANMHSFVDDLFCEECKILNLDASAVKNAPEFTYDKESGRFTYTGTFEANKYYVLKLTNTGNVTLNDASCATSSITPFSANGTLYSAPAEGLKTGETIYLLLQYDSDMTDTILFGHTENR